MWSNFVLFTNQIARGGILIYNEEDEAVKTVARISENPIRKIPYQTPSSPVENGITLLDTPEGPMPIEVFWSA